MPAKDERAWLISYLESFYNNQVIADVLSKVKGGNEANVYCCAAHPSTGLDLIAAKVYRPRMFRNLRNDARYRQGRAVVDEEGKAVHSRREILAMGKNTRFGQQLRHISWLESEFQTMQLLHEAGDDVPKPLMEGNNVILMEYIGDDTTGAPMLSSVRVRREELEPLFNEVMRNVEILLKHNLVSRLQPGEIFYSSFPALSLSTQRQGLVINMSSFSMSRICLKDGAGVR